MTTKVERKKHFYTVHTIKCSKSKPLVVVDLSSDGNAEWVLQLIEGVESLGLPLVVIGELRTSLPEKVLNIKEPGQLEETYKAADFVILPKAKTSQLMRAWANGAVPICTKSDLLEDYDPIKEIGNAFIVDQENEWAFFAALVRGVETYKFPYDWKHLLSQCEKSL